MTWTKSDSATRISTKKMMMQLKNSTVRNAGDCFMITCVLRTGKTTENLFSFSLCGGWCPSLSFDVPQQPEWNSCLTIHDIVFHFIVGMCVTQLTFTDSNTVMNSLTKFTLRSIPVLRGLSRCYTDNSTVRKARCIIKWHRHDCSFWRTIKVSVQQFSRYLIISDSVISVSLLPNWTDRYHRKESEDQPHLTDSIKGTISKCRKLPDSTWKIISCLK